jgi:hypothetical protein
MAVAAVLLLLPSRPAAQADLADAFTTFLTTWLIQGDAAAAVSRFASMRVSDERLLPVETFEADQYAERFSTPARPARPLAREEFMSRMQGLLQTMRGDAGLEMRLAALEKQLRRSPRLPDLLAPVDAKTSGQLWRILSKRKIELGSLPGLPALVYRVRSWDDFSWTASGTVGHHATTADTLGLLAQDHRAVVFRLRSARPDRSAMVCTIWAHESPKSGSAWRFWAVIPVLAD